MALDKFKVFIGGLNDKVKREDLESEFDRFGKTSNVWVGFNPAGFGFVEYDTQDEADAAIEHMNGVIFNGCKLRVEHSHGRTRGGGRGRGRGGFSDREDRGFGGGGYGRGGGYQDRGFRGRGGGGYGNKDDGDGFGGRDGGGYDSGYRSRERGGGRGGGGDRYGGSGDRYGGGRGRGSRFSGSGGGRSYDAPDDDFNGIGRGGDRYRSRSPGSRK